MALISKAWRLDRRGQPELAQNALNEFCKDFGVETMPINPCIYGFIGAFIGEENREYVIQLHKYINTLKQTYPITYQNFKSYYESKAEDYFHRYISNSSEYIKCFDQLNQTLIYAVRNASVEGNLIASSKDFRLIKMFYGNFFEDITDYYIIPVCFNNITNGRSYDKFQTMELKGYLQVNKAGRANPFKEENLFNKLYEPVDSAVRNASHHGGIRIAKNPNEIEYRSENSGQWRTMPYAEYLYKCNELMFIALYLFAMHLLILED